MDRGRHGHVVLFVMCFQHLFLEQEVHPVSDDQCYKLKILSLIVLFYFHHNLYGILQNIPCELLKSRLIGSSPVAGTKTRSFYNFGFFSIGSNSRFDVTNFFHSWRINK